MILLPVRVRLVQNQALLADKSLEANLAFERFGTAFDSHFFVLVHRVLSQKLIRFKVHLTSTANYVAILILLLFLLLSTRDELLNHHYFLLFANIAVDRVLNVILFIRL